MSTTLSSTIKSPTDRLFLGQPWGLATIFGVEMWERFSFYGMQGILAIYLYYSVSLGGLNLSEVSATSIVGAYGGLVYLSTIFASWVADRLLGTERTLFYSAILVMAGHIALSLLPGLSGVGVGLICIALGSGGVKANATSLVGDLYEKEDPRRDAGFSIFYMGINLGALIGPLLTGYLHDTRGFHWGFGLAAIGMGVGLIQYSIFRKNLGDNGKYPTSPLPSSLHIYYAVGFTLALAAIVALCFSGAIHSEDLSNIVVALTIIAAIGYFLLLLRSSKVTSVERSRIWSFIPLFIGSAAFWALYQQQFTVVTIYSDKRLDRTVFGWTIPVSWVQSINPVFIILLAPAFAALWTKLGPRQPITPIKFSLGIAIMGLAFVLFIPMSGAGAHSAPLLGLIGILFVFTIAELLLSPVGLSMSTKLAPQAFHTQMVALFYLSVALGTALSGTLAGYYTEEKEKQYFLVLGVIAIGIGALIGTFSSTINKLMAGIH
ncbi:MAG: peptide MFS transporter [Mycobacteriaceae bacterium]